MPRLPRRTFAPPIAIEHDKAHIVRDDAVGVAPVDLVVQVHVFDGQVSFSKSIIAKIGVGLRCRCRIFVQHITARGDKLVRGVVLVGGDEQSAAEAGTGFADRTAKRVFIRARPTRRIETSRTFVGLRPVLAVFVGGLDDTVEPSFFRAPVGVGDDRIGHGAVRAERTNSRARLKARRCVGCVEILSDDTRRVGRGDGSPERVVFVGLGFGEVAGCDRSRENPDGDRPIQQQSKSPKAVGLPEGKRNGSEATQPSELNAAERLGAIAWPTAKQ